jgi:hypothetical protein
MLKETFANCDGRGVTRTFLFLIMSHRKYIVHNHLIEHLNQSCRFQMLQELIPHSDQKRDKASFLLEVNSYG